MIMIIPVTKNKIRCNQFVFPIRNPSKPTDKAKTPITAVTMDRAISPIRPTSIKVGSYTIMKGTKKRIIPNFIALNPIRKGGAPASGAATNATGQSGGVKKPNVIIYNIKKWATINGTPRASRDGATRAARRIYEPNMEIPIPIT